jgi:hypothetical protein
MMAYDTMQGNKKAPVAMRQGAFDTAWYGLKLPDGPADRNRTCI